VVKLTYFVFVFIDFTQEIDSCGKVDESCVCLYFVCVFVHSTQGIDSSRRERWGAGVETQKNVRGEIEGWGRVPLNEPYAPSLSTIYDGA